MKLAISNIAWESSEETEVAETLQGLGVKNLEIAPTKFWEEPTEASEQDVEKVRSFWLGYGIGIVAFQSLLFKKPDLQTFGDNGEEALDYLRKFTDLAGKMNVSAMVFGSPKNRKVGDLSKGEARGRAVSFFRQLAKTAEKNNVYFCIEPNPEEYGCDFITNAHEGAALVREVNSPGFGLHLDMAGMTLAGDDIKQSILNSADVLKHFHISVPYLEQVGQRDDVDYQAATESLNEIGYDGYVSIEMRPDEVGRNVERVKKAVEFSQSIFGSS